MLFIFDMGGVVTNTFNMNKIYEKLNLSKEDFFNICRQGKDIWHEFEIGKINTNQFWDFFNKRVGLLQRSVIDGFFNELEDLKFSSEDKIQQINHFDYDLFRLYFHPVTNEKTVELIELLKNNNRVVCGTNTIQSHWENHMERGDYSYFHQTYASNKIGFAKPDKRFFEIILEAEGFTPDQAFFTDDKIENCDAAAAVGINTVHFTTAEDLFNKWKVYSK